MQGLNWQALQIPLAAGLNQQTDDRARPSTSLDIAHDVQFDELGGIQTRLPFAALGSSIFGGGTISTARRIVRNGDELLMFTRDSLYSWDAALSKWVLKGTHLAIKLEEASQFVTTGDQINCDRAELSNVVYYAWEDTSVVYLASVDKTTGAVIMAPTAVSGSGTRPRLVAITTAVLLFYVPATGGVFVRDLLPSTPSTIGSSQQVIAAANFDTYFDVTQVIGADAAIGAARRPVNTSYTVFQVATSAKTVTAAIPARTCDGPIAVSSTPTGTQVQVIRGNGTNIQGDLITIATLVDTAHVGKAVGTVASTPVNQIACAHRSVLDSSQYRCYAFWTGASNSGVTAFSLKTNFVDTGGTLGTESVLVRRLGVASRAFDYNGSVYFWAVFAGESSFSGAGSTPFFAQLQNTYFLYRDDATLVAKSTAGRAGGLRPSTGFLPGVALTSGTTGYSWCGTERRIISLGSNQSGYGARAPRDITLTFDSNEARRCVRLGSTLYITGGEVMQYDGSNLVELGYHVFPWYFGAVEVPAGNVADGVYAFKVTARWDNARGEVDRSTTATTGELTIAAGPNGISIVSWPSIYTTHKTANPIAMEVWRTAVNPTTDSPFYLVTSKDPASLTNPNRYVPNDTTADLLPTFNDEFADSVSTTKEANPENGSILESLAPPAATIITATADRLFLAGIAGDPDRVWYSKQRNDGQVAAFNDALVIPIPNAGGDITAVAFLNETLVVFRETAVYALPGEGYDNASGGANYGPARVVSSDVGAVNMESVAVTPMGLIFKSSKGWYLLNRSFTAEYIGGAVSDYDSETPLAVHVLEGQHQIRCLLAARMLTFDWQANQWAEWTISDGLHAAIWAGTYTYLTATGPKAEQTTYTDLTFGLDVETAWIKPADLQGAVRVRKLQVLGEYRSTHLLRARVSYNYDTTVVDDRCWPASPTTVGGPLQVRIGQSRQVVEAIKLRLTAVAASTYATNTIGALVTLSGSQWTATLTGAPGRTVSFAFVSSTTAATQVRDDERYDVATSAWVSSPNNCGVLVTGNDTTALVTILSIETAINAASDLVQVTAHHATPTAIINFAVDVLFDDTTLIAFPDASPTGEALKLTGLALEVGAKPGVYRRLPAAQKVG